MLVLVNIDLTRADMAAFEDYERKVLARLPIYGARLEERLRSVDERTEVHLVFFPDPGALDAFRADPVRVSLQAIWDRSNASSAMTEYVRLQ